MRVKLIASFKTTSAFPFVPGSYMLAVAVRIVSWVKGAGKEKLWAEEGERGIPIPS